MSQHSWRALRHRNFRLFFFGQGISVIGTWMTRIATAWLVYRLTSSALLLGIVSFASQIVPFVLQPVAGVWADRLDRRTVLVWTQAAACLQSFTLAALALGHVITIGEIIALNALQGLINALDTPARQSFLVQMVEGREDLGNAIAINSSMQNGARLVGPAIAGVVIAASSEGMRGFLVDGVSYLAVIASLLVMNVTPREVAHKRTSMFGEVREGWDYIRSSARVRSTLLLFAVIALLGYPFTVLLPVFARSALGGRSARARLAHGGLRAWGASRLGAVAHAFRGSRSDGLPRMIRISAALLGSALLVVGLSRSLWLSLLALVFAGFRAHADSCREQHCGSGCRPRGQACPRHQLLRHGVLWLRASRESPRRHARRPLRCTAHGSWPQALRA